jgi:hypothetical protein
MPFIAELYCKLFNHMTPVPIKRPINVICPMSGAPCDGGGNRHQTSIKIDNFPDLKDSFANNSNKVVPAICSISYSTKNEPKDRWVVCPRRLFSSSFSELDLNHCLQDHERDLLISAGLPKGRKLGVWAEIYLRDSGADANDEFVLNYHFDYVICPIEPTSISHLSTKYEVNRLDVAVNAKKGNYVKGRFTENSIINYAPDLSEPVIIEVMTASTSGSDTEKGTNISSVYLNAINGISSSSPGINRRQVWGRMATQLYAKSCLSSNWGGQTLWVVQDALIEEISKATGLKINSLKSTPHNQKINFAVMKYANDHNDSRNIVFDTIHRWDAGVQPEGSSTMIDLLLPASYPNKGTLLLSMLRRGLSGIIEL